MNDSKSEPHNMPEWESASILFGEIASPLLPILHQYSDNSDEADEDCRSDMENLRMNPNTIGVKLCQLRINPLCTGNEAPNAYQVVSVPRARASAISTKHHSKKTTKPAQLQIALSESEYQAYIHWKKWKMHAKSRACIFSKEKGHMIQDCAKLISQGCNVISTSEYQAFNHWEKRVK